jgi:hypothetical protein
MASVYIRVFKSYGAPDNRQWSNVYEGNNGEVVTPGADPADFQPLADAIVTAERAIHFDAVYFNRVVISTWEPDTGGYNPLDLVTTPLGLRGTRLVGTGAEPALQDLRLVFWVARVAAHGRPGRIFYRGCVAESEVENQAGRWKLTAATTLVTTAFDAYKAALAPHVGAGASVLRLALIGGTLVKAAVPATEAGIAVTKLKRTYVAPYTLRDVSSLVAQGVTVRQLDNPYFDRP